MESPCGCEIARTAAREPDPQARQVLAENAAEFRKQWNCPGVDRPEPSECSPELREKLVPVERLTGASGLKTCPCWYAWQPGAHVVGEAYQWMKEGGLEGRFGRDYPRTLALAVQCVRRGVTARQADDEERRERKLESKRNGG